MDYFIQFSGVQFHYTMSRNKGKQVKGIMLSNSNRKGWHSSLGKPTRNEIKE